MKKILSDRYFLGRKCIYCSSNKLYRLKDKRIKCKQYEKKYSLTQLKKEMLILYYFYLELSASKTADELDIDYGVVHRKFMQFRKRIAEYCNQEAKKLNGELEIDESYFGGRRKGKVHTKIVENVSAEILMNEIKNKTEKGSVFYTDGWKSYKSLHQFGKHNIIRHDKDEFAKAKNHINGIEGFWSFAKERFYKYHGINKNNYPFYLKEMEFRFNHRNESIFNL